MKILGIIPARYGSTRFPGKPLVDIGGQSMIQRVYSQASKANLLDRVVVATDDQRIIRHVIAFGGDALTTRPDHRSGTDRCAEIALGFPEFEAVVNIQGDEPFIDPTQIDQVAQPLCDPAMDITTLATPIRQSEELFNPNVVKLVIDQDGRAMYFSRSPIPHFRGRPPEDWLPHAVYHKHLGLYGFRRNVLLQLTSLAPGRYELAESLEQLRWLEHGYKIWVVLTDCETFGIDTPEDLQRARSLIEGRKGPFS